MSHKRPCPECDARMDAGAVLCIDCGFHRLKGRRLETQSLPVEYAVGNNPRTPRRIGLAIGAAVFGVVFCLVPVRAADRLDPEWLRFFFLGGPVLLATAAGLGTGQRWVVTKSRSGEPLLICEGWLCFLGVPTSTLSLRDWDAVFADYAGDPDRVTGSELFRLHLGRADRSRFLLLYSGPSQERMRELGDAIKEIAGLRWERK